MKYLIFKRFFDIIFSIFVLTLTSPIFLFIIVVQIVQGQDIFFLQIRPGYKTKLFKIIKFKTMYDIKGDHPPILADSYRVSKFGYFLRKFSIDELPQFINVLKGEMSVIGPRPLLVEYLKLYSDAQMQRHDVKPGITGWAQINGRNAITWNEKFLLDLYYIKNISFLLDFKILLKSFYKIFKSSDVNQSKLITMEAFNGNN